MLLYEHNEKDWNDLRLPNVGKMCENLLMWVILIEWNFPHIKRHDVFSYFSRYVLNLILRNVCVDIFFLAAPNEIQVIKKSGAILCPDFFGVVFPE